jgi:hypothetical protein
MSRSEASQKGWDKQVPQGYVSLSEAARIIGRDFSLVRKYAADLGVIDMRGKGKPALIKISDLEGLKEVMKDVRKLSPRAPEPKPKLGLGDPAPKWSEPVLLAPNPNTEFETAIRKVIHLMEKLNIDSITIQDGKAEILRTVSVTKKEEIKG